MNDLTLVAITRANNALKAENERLKAEHGRMFDFMKSYFGDEADHIDCGCCGCEAKSIIAAIAKAEKDG